MIEATTYSQQLNEWRASKDAELRKENSWLALAGLYWLQDGVNQIGSAPSNQIVLPPNAPANAGTITWQDGGLRWQPTQSDAQTIQANSDIITFGDFAFVILERAGTLALRLWDNSRAERETFAGRVWYDADDAYKIEARWEPFAEVAVTSVETMIGAEMTYDMVGLAHFELHGEACALVASLKPTGELSFIMRDATSGQSTYGAARFLTGGIPKDGEVTLDFNTAYSPPCAFTDYATCPLPPKQNILTIPIHAGEKYQK